MRAGTGRGRRTLGAATPVDGALPMGKAGVSGLNSRTVAVWAANLPANCTVGLVRGPVDFTGQDPATSVTRSWAASAFGSTGTVSTGVDTATSCFVRPQVRRDGELVATGNPTWLLRQPPAGGIPAARAA